VLAAPCLALAQTASITGTVTDSSGRAMADVAVSARDTQGGAARATTTGSTGSFTLPELLPGTYAVAVEKTGFQKLYFTGIALSVDQIITLNAHLAISPRQETITVNAADLPPVDLQSALISAVITSQQIGDLPLLLRNPYSLVLLSPGVIQSNTALRGFSANGARERDNNFLLDGVDNNDANVPGFPGPDGSGGLATLNPDAVEEFRVITGNFSAEIGRNDGAVVDIITRRGTNNLHGDAYWFGRYAALGARDFFAPTKNPYTRNDFGASTGGPLARDKAFFFVNYEGQRFDTTITNTSAVPTAAFKTGNFAYLGTPVNVSTPAAANNRYGLALDPSIQKLLALYPAPNGGAIDSIRGLLFFPSASQTVADNFTIRADTDLNSRNAFSARYVFNRFTDPNPGHFDVLPGDLGAIGEYQRAQNLSLRLTSTISPTLTNELRGGGNRANEQFNCDNLSLTNQVGTLDSFGHGPDLRLPSISGFGCSALGDSDAQIHYTGTYTLGDSLTWVTGGHTVKFGGEYRDVYFNGFTSFSSRRAVDFSSFSNLGARPVNTGVSAVDTSAVLQNMASLLLGLADAQTGKQFFTAAGSRTANDVRGYRQHEMGLFLQDSWKLASNFTLNYGLRWEYFGVPYEAHNNLSNLFVAANGTGPFAFTIIGPGGQALYQAQFHDFAPRLGFAWDPFRNAKTSVRGNFGIFYDRPFDNLFGNASGNPPFEPSFTGRFNSCLATNPIAPSPACAASLTAYSNLPLPATVAPTAAVPNGSFASPELIDPNLKSPSSADWSLGVQRTITQRISLEADYVGRAGSHLYRLLQGNQPDPALVAHLVATCTPQPACVANLQFTNLWLGGAVHNTAFYMPALVESTANSIYNGLQTKTNLQLWHGLQAQLSYTYSHAIDNASDPLRPAAGDNVFPVNSYNLTSERGNSDFDIRHVAVLNFTYQVPVGRGQVRWSSGILGRTLEGWETSAIATFEGGLPYDVFGDVDSQHTGVADRATLIGNPQQPSTADETFTGPSFAAFEETPIGQTSNLSRNRFYGPGTNNWDAAFMKNSSLTERFKLQLRFEFYNLFNRTAFAQPDNKIADTLTFGRSTATVLRPDGTSSARQIQIAAKLFF